MAARVPRPTAGGGEARSEPRRVERLEGFLRQFSSDPVNYQIFTADQNTERTDEQLSGDIPERCMKNRSGSPKEASGGAPPG